MLVSAAKFNQCWQNNELRLAFIGMSNIGKTYLSEILESQNGFARIDVDSEIQKALGIKDMRQMAKWLGFPWQENHHKHAQKYLQLEADTVLKNIAGKNLVLDTTGSVIHISEHAIKSIKQRYLIVYIKANKKDLQILQARYFKHPKPTIWAGYYKKQKGMDEKSSLIACYGNLLAGRSGKYSQMADISINAEEFNGCKTGNMILQKIASRL